jgi:hypothetical protein
VKSDRRARWFVSAGDEEHRSLALRAVQRSLRVDQIETNPTHASRRKRLPEEIGERLQTIGRGFRAKKLCRSRREALVQRGIAAIPSQPRRYSAKRMHVRSRV